MKIIEEDKEYNELREFLIEAKKNTYARGGGTNEIKLKNGSRQFVFERSKLKYIDTYFGFDPFVGQEVVYKNGKVIWVMNYCGKILKDIVGVEEIYGFLKKALSKPDESVPLRGPEKFREGDFGYFNVGGGFLNYFRHVETITYKKNERVYELVCDGGIIK